MTAPPANGCQDASAPQGAREARGSGEAYLLLVPYLGCFLVFWLIPLLGGIGMSVRGDVLYGPAPFVGWQHYQDLLDDERFAKALGNTFRYAAGLIVTVIPLAMVLAQALQMAFRRWRPLLLFTMLLPGLTPPAVLALLFLLVFHGQEGLLNQILVLPWGGQAIQWLKDPTYILPALILQSVWRWTGFLTFFFLAGMQSIPRHLYEAAHLETNHSWRVWWHVTVPLLRPVALFGAVYLVVDAFSLFSGAYVLLGGSGSTADAGLLLVSYLYQTAFTFGKFGTAAAMSVAVAPLLLGLLWLCFLLPRHRRAQP